MDDQLPSEGLAEVWRAMKTKATATDAGGGDDDRDDAPEPVDEGPADQPAGEDQAELEAGTERDLDPEEIAEPDPEEATAPDPEETAAHGAEEPAPEEGDTEPAPRIRTRTPPVPVPAPSPGEDGEYDLDDPALYLNRELTWLNFNFRVLHQAVDAGTPLLERLKFIAIASSNIDGFFMKRIGGLKQQVAARVQDVTIDGRSPEEQLAECLALARVFEKRKTEAFDIVQKLLAEEDIRILPFTDVSDEEQAWLRQQYEELIYPLVTPQATDPAHPFPFISNLSLNLLVTLRHSKDDVDHLARVKVPLGPGVPRFLQLPGTRTFVTVGSVMANNLDILFPGMEIVACEFFRVTRNANTEQEEENADDLVELIESELRERRFAPIVRLETEEGMDPVHRGMLAAELGLDEESDVFEVQGLMGLDGLAELTRLEGTELHDPPHAPVDHPALTTERPIFHTVREHGSILLHHPYQSFSTSVERFLQEASVDPKVRAIKMTFYRTSEDSKAISYLMDAARNGKQVAVVMELKARFDEEANLRWASRLGSVGIHVTYGVVGLKTHCKVILVVRQDYEGIRRYAHIGTGNYNADTARLYSDLGLLTCDPGIGHDLTELFNYLTTGYKPKRKYTKLHPAPKLLKRALLTRIDRERKLHESGTPGHIQFKANALEDRDVTRALYEAARAGVRIDLIIRDTCRLRPGLKGLTESVRVVSVVGRFLEHARLYYFKNGGDEEFFIGSADCMWRNLESRVEVLAPVEKPELRDELRFLLDAQLEDEVSAWDMGPDGSYRKERSREPDVLDSQERLIERAESQHWEATRLKHRQIKGISTGNLPTTPPTPPEPLV